VKTFDASGSSDADGDALSYKWDFGDGATATGATAQHAYSKNGSYQVRVIVSDDSKTGCGVASDGFIANVNAAPVADISVKSR
jgi:PKD repeat protein